MSIELQVILILASIGTLFYILRKIRNSQMKTEDAIFWIFFSVALFLISIFPKIPELLSRAMKIQSAANFIFLSIIFVLLVKQFLLTVKISKIENDMKVMSQKFAIKSLEIEQNEMKGNHKADYKQIV